MLVGHLMTTPPRLPERARAHRSKLRAGPGATCIRFATVAVHTTLSALGGVACTKPPAPVVVAPPAAAEARPPLPVRTGRADCDGAVCWVSVELVGNRQVPSDEIFAAMQVLQGGSFNQELLEYDVLVLSALYYDRGYLEVRIPPPVVDRSHDREVRIELAIDEGPRYRVKSVEAYEDRDGLRCAPMGGWSSPLAPGDVFYRSDLVSALQRLRRRYRDRGYAKVEAVPRVWLDPDRQVSKVWIGVVRGQVHSFGRVRFASARATTPPDLLRWIEVTEGARFSETALDRSKERLLASGLFESVDVSTEDGQAPESLDVTFTVSERAGRRAVAAGAPAPAPPALTAPALTAAKPLTTEDASEALDTRPCHAIPVISARHILIAYAGSRKAVPGVTRSRDEARRRAQDALRKIRDGASFTDVAASYTDEPGGRERGGDLGEFDDMAMVDPFSDAAFRLRVGEVSEIVETEYGLHIIQRTK